MTPEGARPAAGSRRAALALEGVGKRYPGSDCDALRDVELTVEDGEVVAVLGASGCGKTTLIRLVAGLEVPDAGTIRIRDRLVAGPGTWVPPERRGVGMVFQDFTLFPHLRVEENVAYGLRSLPREVRRARTESVLAMVGLEGFARRYPHQLSGGQQQRVALARALAPEPGILLLDEPFSSLDVPLKLELREGLVEILRHGRVPALLVVHDVDDVVALADRVAVLCEGRIVRQGAPDCLWEDPDDPYTARFFRSGKLDTTSRSAEASWRSGSGLAVPLPYGLDLPPRSGG